MAQARGHDGGRHLPVVGGSDRQLRGEEGGKEKGEGEKREERGRLAGGEDRRRERDSHQD